MIYYIWVMNMASRYKFSEKEIEEIEQARKENKDKRAECRLKALEMRAKGASSGEVSAATGFLLPMLHSLSQNIEIMDWMQFPAITTVETTAI